ncbi:ribonuclease H-like domain-containing protein [Tanacetum coccineum]
MTNSNTPPPPPALTLVEKLYAVYNINSLVPEKLDLQESNYSTWSYFFKGHCSNFNVLNHIDGSTSTSDPPTDEWITADSIVKSWIFLTLSPTLRKRMISTNPASAKAAWDTPKRDDTPDAYFSKIDSIITLLTDLGSTMDDDDIVTYAINGLSEKYGSLAQIIAHKDPFPDLATVRTMVTTEEMRLRSKQPILSTSTTSSSPQVLLATSQPRIQDNRNNRDRDARNENKTEICRNFGRGYCRWGTNCRFIHASPKGTNNPRPNSSQHNTRSMPKWALTQLVLIQAANNTVAIPIQAPQNLLALYGLSISPGSATRSTYKHGLKSYPIAFRDPNWYRAMLDEYTALIKNNTWILVPRPPNANIVRSMWLFRHKYNADGTLSRYKARLVANGSTQLAGIDVDETFSPVVKPATIRTVLSLAISRHWPVHQLDVKNAFLHGSLSETVYMHQPPGFRDLQHPDHGADTAYLLLYVDDIVLTASSSDLLQQIITSLHAEFSMTDLGSLNYFLGIYVTPP